MPGSIEDEVFIAEILAVKMRLLLEEHGWCDCSNCDPVLILIAHEEGKEFPTEEE